mmetsp:Transcript_38885/g.92000  ORF Transcript_38885/g.92000 Transcript_38885/m.92000 type:complete len:482 (+) Transcript_38885:290-1735(+)
MKGHVPLNRDVRVCSARYRVLQRRAVVARACGASRGVAGSRVVRELPLDRVQLGAEVLAVPFQPRVRALVHLEALGDVFEIAPEAHLDLLHLGGHLELLLLELLHRREVRCRVRLVRLHLVVQLVAVHLQRLLLLALRDDLARDGLQFRDQLRPVLLHPQAHLVLGIQLGCHLVPLLLLPPDLGFAVGLELVEIVGEAIQRLAFCLRLVVQPLEHLGEAAHVLLQLRAHVPDGVELALDILEVRLQLPLEPLQPRDRLRLDADAEIDLVELCLHLAPHRLGLGLEPALVRLQVLHRRHHGVDLGVDLRQDVPQTPLRHLHFLVGLLVGVDFLEEHRLLTLLLLPQARPLLDRRLLGLDLERDALHIRLHARELARALVLQRAFLGGERGDVLGFGVDPCLELRPLLEELLLEFLQFRAPNCLHFQPLLHHLELRVDAAEVLAHVREHPLRSGRLSAHVVHLVLEHVCDLPHLVLQPRLERL